MEASQLVRKDRRLHTPTPPETTPLTGKPPFGRKFMQTLDDQVFRALDKFARQRGVTIQGLIRAVIVPDWIESQENEPSNFPTPQPVTLRNLAEPGIRNHDLGPTNAKGPVLIRR